jgi:hypothetical protein
MELEPDFGWIYLNSCEKVFKRYQTGGEMRAFGLQMVKVYKAA